MTSRLLPSPMPRRLSPLLVVLAAMTLAACAAPMRSVPPAMDLDAEVHVLGVWDWEGPNACRENSHVITFEEAGTSGRAGRTLVLNHQRPLSPQSPSGRTVYAYRVVRSAGNSVTGVMEDEHRLDARGEPVAWTLTMFTPDVYRWSRSDWPAGQYTNAVVRCSGSAPSRPASASRS